MAATLKTSSRTRAGLIALIALRQGRIMRERRARELAEKGAGQQAEPKPKKRGWFG